MVLLVQMVNTMMVDYDGDDGTFAGDGTDDEDDDDGEDGEC